MLRQINFILEVRNTQYYLISFLLLSAATLDNIRLSSTMYGGTELITFSFIFCCLFAFVLFMKCGRVHRMEPMKKVMESCCDVVNYELIEIGS